MRASFDKQLTRLTLRREALDSKLANPIKVDEFEIQWELEPVHDPYLIIHMTKFFRKDAMNCRDASETWYPSARGWAGAGGVGGAVACARLRRPLLSRLCRRMSTTAARAHMRSTLAYEIYRRLLPNLLKVLPAVSISYAVFEKTKALLLAR